MRCASLAAYLIIGSTTLCSDLLGQELLYLDVPRSYGDGLVTVAREDVFPVTESARVWLPLSLDQEDPPISAANAGLRSLLLPGLGHVSLGRGRSFAYFGLEALGWLWYADRRTKAAELRSEYRNYAWQEARLQGARRIEGDFAYYEVMSQWDRSGRFDRNARSEGTQPELNPSVYNGLIWSRAVGIFSVDAVAGPGDSQYEAAIRYYEQHAYGPNFLWDWVDTDGGRSTYAEIIRTSDDRFRQARDAIGFLIGNHLVSAVDAFLSARAGIDIETRLGLGASGGGVALATKIRGPGR